MKHGVMMVSYTSVQLNLMGGKTMGHGGGEEMGPIGPVPSIVGML